MTLATDGTTAVTSGTPTVYYTIDGGAQGTGAGASVHEGNGQWSYAPAQAETNGDHVIFTMVLATAITQAVNVYPVSYDPTDAALGLNNVAATDIVSSGAITTAGGAVSTVTTLTGHTAQTGDTYALANGAAGFVAIDTVVDSILVDTAEIGSAGAGLTNVTINAASVDLIWDEVITTSAHNVANSAGKRLRQSTGLLQAESAVDDPGAAATTTAFNTDLTEADNFWNDSLVVFTSGTLSGQAKPILTYTQASGAIVLDEALTSAPADNDEFTIYSTHIHSVSQIADGVWDEATSGHVGVGSTGLALTSIFTTAMTESYAADGAAPTPAQSLFLIQQALTEVAIVSTTETIKKLDGSTAAATLTLDDASSPTSKTRAT